MSTIEQHTKIPQSERITSARGRTLLLAEDIFFGPLERRGLRKLIEGANDEYSPNFDEEYRDGISDGHSPILVGPHTAHIDGVFMAKVAKRLTGLANEVLPRENQMKGCALIYAASLHYGYQGAMLKGFSDAGLEVLEENNTTVFLHTRPQDVERYKMKPQPIQEYKDLIAAAKNGYGMAILAEGETKGGKTNPETGKPFGMGRLMPGAIDRPMAAIYAADKIPMIIPISIVGGSRAQNPNTRLPTLEAIIAGLGGNNHLVDIHVSSPLNADEGEVSELYKNKDSVGLNTLIGKQIAAHLPPEYRGVYA